MSTQTTDNRLKALIADIEKANNRYLILEYMAPGYRTYVGEVAKTGAVIISNGVVHLPTTKPQFFQTARPVKAFALRSDGPDYEGAILDRQAAQGMYD